MRFINDYKSSVNLSLNVLCEQRKKLYTDTMTHYSTVYMGLHEFESDTVRNLYFESYQMEWLDNHWNQMRYFLTRSKGEYPIDSQKDITAFFADALSVFIDEYTAKDGALYAVSMSELLKIKKESLNAMIEASERWEEKSNLLQVDLQKHREHYNKLIANAKKRKEDNGNGLF